MIDVLIFASKMTGEEILWIKSVVTETPTKQLFDDKIFLYYYVHEYHSLSFKYKNTQP